MSLKSNRANIHWRRTRPNQPETPAEQPSPNVPVPTGHRITGMSVSDDAHLAGPYYPQYVAEIRRRQALDIEQEPVCVWYEHPHMGIASVYGRPHALSATAYLLQIIDLETGRPLGTVGHVADRNQQFFFPAK